MPGGRVAKSEHKNADRNPKWTEMLLRVQEPEQIYYEKPSIKTELGFVANADGGYNLHAISSKSTPSTRSMSNVIFSTVTLSSRCGIGI